MSNCKKVVTPVSEISQSELPPEFIAYALIVTHLEETGVLDEIAKRLRLDRNKGYQGIDLVLVLLAFFCARMKVGGIRKFLDKKVPRYRGRLAALGGRDGIPSQGSVSRMLKALKHQQVDEVSSWLLGEAVDYSPLVSHPAVKCLDCNQQTWDIFDFDITATALRQRGVPDGDDLPPAERTSDEVAASGRTGRKRGHMKISRATVQHRGSRLWIDAQVAKGNGSWPELVAGGLEAIEQFADLQGLDASRSIVCSDGEAGGHPQMRCGIASPTHFVTRLTYYSPLNRKAVIRGLEQQHWQAVPDSGSGPKRRATEYGTLEVDGTHTVRLVVTRFRADQKRGAGICVDGWQYEVFATDLSSEAFAPADIAWIYYGRCGQENYFSLEDREFELDHLFSQNLAGQKLANVVGLWLWNLELIHGLSAHGGLPEVDDTPRRRTPTDESTDKPTDVETLTIDSGPLKPRVDGVDVEPSIAAFDWAGYFANKPGFEWDNQLGSPICANGHPLTPHRICMRSSGNLEVHFRIQRGPCRSCPVREPCTNSTDPGYRKGISVTIPLVDGDDPLGDDDVDRRLQWTFAEPTTTKGPRFEPRAAVLLPQKLRRQFEDCCNTSRARVDIERPRRKPDSPSIYAMTAQQRQRRRRTWRQRIAWNQLDERTKLTMTLFASPEMQRYLDYTQNVGSPVSEAGIN